MTTDFYQYMGFSEGEQSTEHDIVEHNKGSEMLNTTQDDVLMTEDL